MHADGIANIVDPNQTAPSQEQSDLGLHCFAHTCMSQYFELSQDRILKGRKSDLQSCVLLDLLAMTPDSSFCLSSN